MPCAPEEGSELNEMVVFGMPRMCQTVMREDFGPNAFYRCGKKGTRLNRAPGRVSQRPRERRVQGVVFHAL
jgi:hypothetical protein